MRKQTAFRLRLPDSPRLTQTVRLFDEARLNGKFSHDPTPTRHGLATMLRAEMRGSIKALTECSPAHLDGNLSAARALREVVRLVVKEQFVGEHECQRTERQLQHPLTLADFLAALEYTIQAHRTPAYFEDGRQLAEVKSMMAGLARTLAQLASVAGIPNLEAEGER